MADDKLRRQRLWKSMQQRGLQKFMHQRPGDFLRRAKKGIPAEYRAEVWKTALKADAHAKAGLYKDRAKCLESRVGEMETFWMFFSLMECSHLNGFYRRQFPLLKRYLWAFEELLSTTLPELQQHFLKENLQHAVYLHQWFLTLFISSLPLPMVLVFWDAIICGGLQDRAAVAARIDHRYRREECDFESIGRIAVQGSEQIGMPEQILDVLRRPLPLRTDDLMERTPQSPPRRRADSDEEPLVKEARGTTYGRSNGSTRASSAGGKMPRRIFNSWDSLRTARPCAHDDATWYLLAQSVRCCMTHHTQLE
eukprot:g3861.t1